MGVPPQSRFRLIGSVPWEMKKPRRTCRGLVEASFSRPALGAVERRSGWFLPKKVGWGRLWAVDHAVRVEVGDDLVRLDQVVVRKDLRMSFRKSSRRRLCGAGRGDLEEHGLTKAFSSHSPGSHVPIFSVHLVPGWNASSSIAQRFSSIHGQDYSPILFPHRGSHPRGFRFC